MKIKGLGIALLSVLGLVAAVPGVAKADAVSSLSYTQCLGDLCVGDAISVTAGIYAGYSGHIIDVDVYNHVFTVETATHELIYPRLGELSSMYTQVPCIRRICVGSHVRVKYGYYRGYEGVVTLLNSARHSATVRTFQGVYIEVQVSDLKVRYVRPHPRPVPVPRPRYCPPGRVYDPRIGACVRVRPYPHPHPVPHPRPMPRPAPRPMPRPAPAPRPMPRPAPAPRPMPRPAPAPRPMPRPAPAPRPMPRPAPAPRPMPRPAPAPRPMPRPAPAPRPAPRPPRVAVTIDVQQIQHGDQTSFVRV